MSATVKVPRGCFAVSDWNGEILIFDPNAPITDGCAVLVHLRDDLRVRFVGTYIRKIAQQGTIKVRVDVGEREPTYRDFDLAVVDVAKLVSVQEAAADFRSTMG